MHRPQYLNRLVVVLVLVYLVITSVYMIAHREWFSYDQFFIAALVGTILLGRTKQFVIDWVPFLALLFSYDMLRGLVPTMIKTVHIMPMIRLDQAIFGFVPTIKLQGLLFNPAILHWYDYLAVVLYLCHFVVPMLVGFIFWLNDRRFFRDYALGILLLSYATFGTYIAFPAMPPWMASSQGYLPPVQNIAGAVMNNFLPSSIPFPTLFTLVDSDPVAAMPSLHAAYPALVFLFIYRKGGRRSLVLLPYVLGVWFAVMYLGEHYCADVLAGATYAIVVFLLVTNKEYLWRQITRLAASFRAKGKGRHVPSQTASRLPVEREREQGDA